jgi:hypothetical protein
MMSERPLTIETEVGKPVQVGGRTLTPETWSLRVRLPFGGWSWVRPTAVTITENGESTRYPIRDVTREAIWFIYGLTGVMILLVLLRVAARNVNR